MNRKEIVEMLGMLINRFLEIIIFNFIPFWVLFNYKYMFLEKDKYSSKKLIFIQAFYFSYIFLVATDIRDNFLGLGLCISLIMLLIGILTLRYFVDNKLSEITAASILFYMGITFLYEFRKGLCL
jgi:hypothetical protein